MVTSTYASAPGSASTAVTGADPSWARLYRIGGVCAGVFVVMVTAGIVLAVAAPAAPTEGG